MMELVATRCPYCGPANVVRDTHSGEDACARCGTVLGDSGAPLQDTNGQNTPTPDNGLGGYMGGPAGASRDAAGLTVPNMKDVTRMRMWQFRTISRSGGPISIRRGEAVIRTLSDKLSLPACVRLDAIGICDRACRLGMAKGRGAAAVAAAAVLLAVRRADMPRRSSEIETAADIRGLDRHYSALCKRLETGPPPPRPDLYVAKVASGIGLPESVARKATGILDAARESGITAGRDPAVLAAGAVHAAAVTLGHKASRAKIARAGGVSVPAVSYCSKIMLDAAAARRFRESGA